LIWGGFYLFCVGIFLEWTLESGVSIFVFEYSLVTALFWRLTFKEERANCETNRRRVRFALSDVFIALALFSLAIAAGVATISDWPSVSEPLIVVVLNYVAALPVLGFVGLIGFGIDAGLRDVTNSSANQAASTCVKLCTIGIVVAGGSYLAIASRQPAMFLFVLPAFVAIYVLCSLTQDLLLVAAGLRVDQSWSALSTSDEKRITADGT
jgi:hypothetical protein